METNQRNFRGHAPCTPEVIAKNKDERVPATLQNEKPQQVSKQHAKAELCMWRVLS